MAIDKYLDNITSQHRDKPKFIGWLSSNLTIIDGIYNTLKTMDEKFDIDNAIGNQLDVLGTVIGRKRTLTFQPVNGYDPVLDDETYRVLLKAKIAMNNWDGTIPQMYSIWNDIFGLDNDLGLQLQDNQDMSFNAYVTGYVDQIQQDLIQHGYIIPKPQGVKVNYIGRSKINSRQYSAMKVTVSKVETIKTNWDPTEKINSNQHLGMKVGVIKTEVIKMQQPVNVIWGALKATNPLWSNEQNNTWTNAKTY
ncbi:DUF2612 domain-containing protein [Clostridium sp.]|uniref:DUF2612 domain-containing protein n=1 Tax=Clostridium sp. TaxID=1506 RepID=UPI00260C880C|nr:DUF2612 domain-containing protein [Clostridium sp.]